MIRNNGLVILAMFAKVLKLKKRCLEAAEESRLCRGKVGRENREVEAKASLVLRKLYTTVLRNVNVGRTVTIVVSSTNSHERKYGSYCAEYYLGG